MTVAKNQSCPGLRPNIKVSERMEPQWSEPRSEEGGGAGLSLRGGGGDYILCFRFQPLVVRCGTSHANAVSAPLPSILKIAL